MSRVERDQPGYSEEDGESIIDEDLASKYRLFQEVLERTRDDVLESLVTYEGHDKEKVLGVFTETKENIRNGIMSREITSV
jgi:ATP-dependent DNA ligase